MLTMRWCGVFSHTNENRKGFCAVELLEAKNVTDLKYIIDYYVDRMRDYGYILEDKEIIDIWEV